MLPCLEDTPVRRQDPVHIVTRVAATKARDRLAEVAARAGVEQPPGVEGREDAVEALVGWCSAVVGRLGVGSGP